MKREILDAKIKKAETEEERAQLIEERNQLDRDLGGMIETRWKKRKQSLLWIAICDPWRAVTKHMKPLLTGWKRNYEESI